MFHVASSLFSMELQVNPILFHILYHKYILDMTDYKFLCRSNVLTYTRLCWKALKKGQEMLQEPEEDAKLRKNICFMVTITESIPQLLMSCLVLRSFGMSVDFFTKMFQLFSLMTSSVSPCFAFGDVS